MKKLIIVLLFVIPFLTSSAYAFESPRKWDKTDKILFGAFVAGQTINYFHTKEVYANPEWYEITPYMNKVTHNGEHLLEYKIISTAIIGLAAHYIPKHRKKILTCSNIIVIGFIGHDIHAGVKLRF